MTIDAEKLEEAINYVDRHWRWTASEDDDRQALLLEAALITLRSLPRYKEVEISVWKVVDDHGNYGTDCTQEIAERLALQTACRAVRLTGTAKVRA